VLTDRCVQESDSTGTKFEGALINALIFVVIVGAMTFVLFLLFKYKVRHLNKLRTPSATCTATAHIPEVQARCDVTLSPISYLPICVVGTALALLHCHTESLLES
jgi:hypothetical protein